MKSSARDEARPEPEGEVARLLAQARLRHLTSQWSRLGARAFIPLLLACAGVWKSVPAVLVILWPICFYLSIALRARAVRRYEGEDPAVALERLRHYPAIGGLSFSVPVCLFFPWLSLWQRGYLVILFGLVASFTVHLYSFYLPMYRRCIQSILLPFGAVWFVFGLLDYLRGGVTFDVAAACAVVLLGLSFVGFQYGAARSFADAFRESVMIRFEKDQLNQQLLREQAALREARDFAEEASRAKNQFLAAASHVLRQPMHTLSLLSAALGLRQLDPRSKAIVEKMGEALHTLGVELDMLLDIAKLDAGVVAIARAPTAVDELLGRLAREYEAAADRKGLRLECDCPTGLVAMTDPMQCERVVRNLLDNAIKYTDVGHVRVAGYSRGPMIGVEVEDTGCGIPEAERELIYREFYQINNPERDRTWGMGLGLAIVSRLVKMLEIKLSLESNPGRGSVFRLELPGSDAAPVIARELEVPSNSLRGCCVLVIDDEGSVRDAMRTILSEMGCAVQMEDALAASSTVRPDIVLADFRLRSRVTGIDVVRDIRATIGFVPALLISGDTAPDRIAEALASGLTLLHKPLTVERLGKAISEHVGTIHSGHRDRPASAAI